MLRLLCFSLLLMPVLAFSACRSQAPVKQFKIATGYPHGRPGYVVDHVCALAQGGIDDPINMQWQTVTQSRVKDKIENTPVGKSLYCRPSNSTPTRQVFNCK